MYEDFTLIKGEKAGSVSIILAGVHGNETCGIKAFQKLLPSLEIERGEVWFGYGNPKAIEQSVRFTKTNLNRLFKKDEDLSETEKASYEYQRAQVIKEYSDSFNLIKEFKDFEEVVEGQVIGLDGVQEVLSHINGYILFARNRSRVGEEGFILAKRKATLHNVMQGC